MSEVDNVMKRLNRVLLKEIDDLNFPCAICSLSFGDHDIAALKKCFQSIPTVPVATEAEQKKESKS